ncbi:MAG TPA: 4-carboxy-4-hydroxy-2-oxoadipate aldolase/oxaloacetate decarboxylase [Anaerolineales bacterium]|nr:4-carboxy-4-hydroxy-2-oxoadipate aldolase/oxaloacetate decarboxylase [Anaerolineales bacterium]
MITAEIRRTAAGFGVATVYEASGREGLIDIPLIQIIPGSRAAGPARTVLCGQDDNLMVHAVMEQIQPGEVLVLAMPEPAPVALLGELLATQAQVRGAAGILVDAAVRDQEELVALGLPVWSRYLRARGAEKRIWGKLNFPVTIGGTAISPGDLVILDADGGVCVRSEQIEAVLAAAQERLEKEDRLRSRLVAGELSYDIHNLRPASEGDQD